MPQASPRRQTYVYEAFNASTGPLRGVWPGVPAPVAAISGSARRPVGFRGGTVSRTGSDGWRG
jgi:hypothetical protein